MALCSIHKGVAMNQTPVATSIQTSTSGRSSRPAKNRHAGRNVPARASQDMVWAMRFMVQTEAGWTAAGLGRPWQSLLDTR